MSGRTRGGAALRVHVVCDMGSIEKLLLDEVPVRNADFDENKDGGQRFRLWLETHGFGGPSAFFDSGHAFSLHTRANRNDSTQSTKRTATR